MHTKRFALPLLAVALTATLGLVGCSGDTVSTPTAERSDLKSLGPVIGPAEIVLCLDLSDSTTSDELAAMTAALGSCLADDSLVPRDGNVSIAGVVFGDSAFAFLDTAVVVTAQSLEDVILPTLQDLNDSRPVGEAGYDLSGALDAAGAILAASTRPDLHVLYVGGGAVNDADAVAASCAALTGAGVMISAVAWGDGPADVPAACAASSGGFFAPAGADPAAICARALAYMLQVELDMGPESTERERDEEHAVTALVFRGGDAEAFPVVGHEVGFSVIDGPNSGVAATAYTDTAGAAHFAYAGDGGPGLDTIVAETVHPGTGVALSDTVTVFWANAAPDCDAGGPYFADVAGDTVLVALDANASFDADGDSLRFAWSVEGADAEFDDAASATPVLTLYGAALCADSLLVHLTVSDGYDESVCTTAIILDDRRPAVFELFAEPLRLWSPNHKYVTVTPDMLIATATDACGDPIDLADLRVLEVTSDEPDDHLGDGRTTDDIVVHCPATVELRAERMGGGNGRVYSIVYGLTGADGEPVTVTARVEVPHDNSGAAAIDDEGMGHTVTADCASDDE